MDYIRETGNHVLYRVTPLFESDNLIAFGVEMEALSVEDRGTGISFHIFVYNVQPGVLIDYKTGNNQLDPDYDSQDRFSDNDAPAGERTELDAGYENNPEQKTEMDNMEGTYILNTNTHRFHYPSCDSVSDMKEKNKAVSTKSREEIIGQGYQPCERCKP